MLLVTTFAASVLFFSAQQGAVQPQANSTPTVTPKFLPTKGLIDQGTYKNPSIGLEFKPAENLQLQEPELKGTPGTTPLLITIQAVSGGGLLSARSLTTFYADSVAYYPEEQRNVLRYLKKIIRANEIDGWQHVDNKPSEQMTGILFSRVDFDKADVHEAVLVTVRNGYAFEFIFAGSDIGTTNKLIAATTVKFTL